MADPAGLNEPGKGGLRARLAGVSPTRVALVLLVVQLVAAACLVLDPPALAPLAVAVAVGLSGYALVRHAGIEDPLLEVLLGAAVAICLTGLVSVAQAYLGWWNPRTTVALMLAAGALASEIEIVRLHASGRVAETPAAAPEKPAAAPGSSSPGTRPARARRAPRRRSDSPPR